MLRRELRIHAGFLDRQIGGRQFIWRFASRRQYGISPAVVLLSVGEIVRIHLFAVIATAVALASSAAQAITFNFESIDPNTPSASTYQMSAGGVDLTIRAGSFQAGGNVVTGGGEKITFNGFNMGLGENGIGVDNRSVDGSGLWKDALIFGFSKDVLLESIEFSFFRHGYGLSNFQLFSGVDLAAFGGAVGIPADGTYSFFGGLLGQLFGIGAPGDWDRFKIRSLTVSEPSPVPLPAALPLFGAALLGIAALKRRRNKAA